MSVLEQSDLYEVFRRVGEGLSISKLPRTYSEWKVDRRLHLERDLTNSELTSELYERYRRSLGWWRYEALLRVQGILLPDQVRRLLGLRSTRWLRPTLGAYRVMVRVGLRPLVHRLVMPPTVLPEVRLLDYPG